MFFPWHSDFIRGEGTIVAARFSTSFDGLTVGREAVRSQAEIGGRLGGDRETVNHGRIYPHAGIAHHDFYFQRGAGRRNLQQVHALLADDFSRALTDQNRWRALW